MSQVLLLNPRRRSYRRPSRAQHSVRGYVEHRLGRTIRVRAHESRNPSRHWVRPHASRSASGRRESVRGHYSNPRGRHHRYFGRRPHTVRGHYMRDMLPNERGRRVWVRQHWSNPRRRRLTNPRELGGMMGDIKAASIGAAGGVGLKVVWGYVSPHLPTAVQSGYGALAGQTGVVLAIGYGLDRAMPRHRRTITMGVVGALTVITYSALVQLLSKYVPNLAGLQDYTDYTVGAYMPGSGGAAAVGLPAPAAVIGAPAHLKGYDVESAGAGVGAYMPNHLMPGYVPQY